MTPAQRSARSKYVLSSMVLLVVSIGVFFAITNLQQIQNLFPKADQEPANIMVNTTAVLGTMPRPWRNFAQGGEDHNWRMQGALVGQVKALNPEYIRLDHIYTFYDIVGGSPGNLTFDFSKLDLLLNDIKATGATPYISLSYMPPVLSGGDILAKPTNWNDWQTVVRRTIEHISGTRGIPNVHYEVWNEPDLFGDWKTYGDKNYLELYGYAARGAAQAKTNQAFKFGGPGITALYENWFNAVSKYALDNNLRYDFFSWHRYDDDVNVYRQDMIKARTWVQAYPQLEATLDFQITEWGHDSKNHAGYDGNYGAAHTVAGAIEMVGVVERAFVFEIQDGKDPAGQEYWGRWGLFSHNDFGAHAKPRYHALLLLDRLGTQRLQLQGKGSFVKGLAAKGSTGEPQVVLSNYDPRGRNTQNVPVTFTNIQPGEYTISQEFLGGRKVTVDVATTSAALKTDVVMPANSVVLVEMKRKLPE